MNRRSLLQVLGVATLALLGSCLGRTGTTGEYPSLHALAVGGLDSSDATTDREPDPANGDVGTGDPSDDGGSNDGGLGGEDGSGDGPPGEEEPPDAFGFDVEGFRADLAAAQIENGSAGYADGALTVAFDSTASNGGEAERELKTVLDLIDGAITDPDAFDGAVERIVIRIRRPDGSKARPLPVNPDWALAYRAGDITMSTYLERIRGTKP